MFTNISSIPFSYLHEKMIFSPKLCINYDITSQSLSKWNYKTFIYFSRGDWIKKKSINAASIMFQVLLLSNS